MRDDFAIFIPSYDRCEILKQKTLHMLKEYNYSGKWYVVVDDNDPQLEIYKEKIPEEHLLIFHKPDYYDYYDTCYNKKNIEAKLYPVAFIDDISKKLDLKYYLMLDDDITKFLFRYNDNGKLLSKDLNYKTFEKFLTYYTDFLNDTCYSVISFDISDLLVGGVQNILMKNGYNYNLSGICMKKVNSDFKFCNVFNEIAASLQLNALKGNYVITLPYVFFNTKFIVKDEYTIYKRDRGGCEKQYGIQGTVPYNNVLIILMVAPSFFLYMELVNDKINTVKKKMKKKNYYPKIIDYRWKK